MATRKFTQNNFTQGQVGPLLLGRGETPIYKAGLEICENFLCLPQGGITKRKGFEFISANPDASVTPDGSTALSTVGFHPQSRLFSFIFSDLQEYIMVAEPADNVFSSNATLHIFYQDTRVAKLVNGVNGAVLPFTTSNIGDIRMTQSFDYMILVHKDMRPIEIVRGSSNTDWTANNLNFDHYPMVNFNFDSTLAPSAKTGSITLTLAGGTYNWVNASFPDGHVGMYVNVNGGQAEITSISSGTVANATIIYELVDTATAQGNEWEITAFSNLPARLGGGWPRSVTFHQNRLIFGGSRDRPQTIFGSQSGDFFNFDKYSRVVSSAGAVTGEISDTSALLFTISSDQLNLIRHLVSQQSLFIFTSDGEFDMSGEPVTPSNVLVRQQTRYGCNNGVSTPVVVDNEVLFPQRGGSVVRAFVYNFNTDAYSAKNYNLVHHDILSGASNLTFLKNYDNTNNNFIFAINDDGSMAVLGVNTEYTVVGWTIWTTDGTFKSAGVADDSLYVLVNRKASDGSSVNGYGYLEKLTTQNIYLDCFHTSNAIASSFTGAIGLENQTVACVADGLVHPDVSVNAAGNFSLTRQSASTQVGMAYTSQAKTLPIQIATANLTTLGERVRKVAVELQFDQSKYLKVDGYSVPFREFSADAFAGTSIFPFTGLKRMRLSGYSKSPQINMISDLPLPVTLLSITTEIKFGVGKIQERG